MNTQRKKHDAFLSFADPDRELAECLSNLFSELNKAPYFAPLDLPKAGTPQWQKVIISAIRQSHAFLPVYTRHSIRRPWVLYESGVADAWNVPRFPARVSSVAISDLDYLPSGNNALCYDLSDEESLADLLVNVCLQSGGTREQISPTVRRSLHRMRPTVNRIIVLSKTRWVFIAGNLPNNAFDHDSPVKWHKSPTEYLNRLQRFVEALTETLFDEGFSISACPQVPHVGKDATRKALTCLDSKDLVAPVDFKIGGIYPIDRVARDAESPMSESAQKKWLRHIMAFRKTYLAQHEWLLIIGGNVGTLDEYKAAKECGVRVFPIPCFGGTGLTIANGKRSRILEPCKSCHLKDASCGTQGIAQIVSSLKGMLP